MARLLSAPAMLTAVTVGIWVSTEMAPDVVLPLPALPDASLTPARLTDSVPLVLAVSAIGVRVAVQVRPPSLERGSVMLPLLTVTSVAVKPDTTSLNVKVTGVV